MASDVYTLTIEGPGKNALSTAVMQDVIRQVREAAGRPTLVIGSGLEFDDRGVHTLKGVDGSWQLVALRA